jgi:hypothetical protein
LEFASLRHLELGRFRLSSTVSSLRIDGGQALPAGGLLVVRNMPSTIFSDWASIASWICSSGSNLLYFGVAFLGGS